MGGHDSDPSVGPGYFVPPVGVFFSLSGFIFFSLLFDFFFGVLLCFFALALSPCIFPFLFFVSLFCYFSLRVFHFYFLFTFLCFFVSPFSLFQCIGVAGVCMLWHGIVLLLSTWYNVAACVVVL